MSGADDSIAASHGVGADFKVQRGFLRLVDEIWHYDSFHQPFILSMRLAGRQLMTCFLNSGTMIHFNGLSVLRRGEAENGDWKRFAWLLHFSSVLQEQ